MAKNFLSDLSTTAASNTDIVGEDIQGSANVSKGDNVIRNLASILAKFYDDLGGVNTVGGTGDAITVTAAQGWTAYGSGANQIDTGALLVFKAGAANTGATTIAVNSLSAKKVRNQGDSALSANAIVSGGTYILKYDAAYDSAAGAWVLLNPSPASAASAATTTNILTGTDTSAYATSDAIAALWEKGSNIASAGTISIGEGGLFHITGTTTITDIDFATAKDGRGAWLIFDGALTLTHNSTTLILPGGANIPTAAGDMAYVVQDNSDNVYVRYFKADGTAVVSSSSSGTWTLIGTLTFNASPKTQALGGTYKELLCVFDAAGTNNATANLSVALTDDGVTYDTARTITIAATASTDYHDGHLRILNTGVAATTKRILPALFTKISSGVLKAGSPYVTTSVQSSETGITHSIRFDSSAGAPNAGTIAIYGLS